MRIWGLRLRVFVGGLGLALLCALTVGIVALVASDSAPAEESAAEQGAKVVRELPAKRTVNSSTYLLDDGRYRTLFSQAPLYYKDAEGAFQPIDLTPTAGANGTLEVTKAPVEVVFANEAEGAPPVTVKSAAGTVAMDLLEAAEDEGAATASGVRYPSVLPEVDVLYEAQGDGVKETLILASAAAPDTYTYRVTHAGFALKQDESGQWGLYAAKATQPAFVLGALTVNDSSSDEAELPAFCDGARLSVSPGKGESTLTYTVPREWLADPARVYPVEIDPNLFSRSSIDAYLSAGYPNTSYGSSIGILCGKVSAATGTCIGLIRWNAVNTAIPAGAHVSAATFSLYQYWQASGDHTYLYRLSGNSTDWTESSTWNSVTIPSWASLKGGGYIVSGTTWLDASCAAVVQGWVSGTYVNRGFGVAQLSYQSESYARKYRSGEWTTITERPKLSVDWEEPTTAVTLDKSTAVVGETVTATVDIGQVDAPYTLYDTDQVTSIQMGVNRADASATRRRGLLGWFKSAPAGEGWVHQQARNESNQPDGYFAYYASASVNAERMTPLLDECVISDDHDSATFVFAVPENWGEADDNRADTLLEMSSGSATWNSGWVVQDEEAFDVSESAGTPAALSSVSATTTVSSSWFTGSVNDSSTQGRGGVTLSWPAVPLADSYKVLLWDGAKYNQLAVTGNTSYTIATNIFPTDTQIASLSSQDNPFDRANGVPLRDNPNLLYQKMAGSGNTDTDYRFRVVPHNSAGAGVDADADECAPLRITLDNRTVTANEDPQHADYDLESWNGHDLGARLETGALTARTTDLTIASWGPSAEVSRTYLSSETSAGLYAPGWFFNFEQNLDIGQSEIVYTDALRQTHSFSGSGSSWSAPNGFLASLAPDGSDWVLRFYDGETLVFDSSGTLIALKDDHDNTTSYTWANGLLTTITAANNQEIDLSYASGKLIEAAYTTAQGTRSVSYGGSGASWTLTRYPNTSCASELTYAYADDRLASITQGDWPAANDSAAFGFSYSSGKLSGLHYPDYDATNKPDARLTIAYDTNEATIDRYGTVEGDANEVMNRELLVWRGVSAGVPYQLTSRTRGTSLDLTETYAYAFDRQLAGMADSEGGLSASSIDLNHDLVSTTTTTGSLQSLNQTSDYGYDAEHRQTSEKAYQSASVYALTTNTYAGADVTATQTVDQNSAVLSATTYTYDAAGRLTQEKKLITGTPESGTWTQTDTSNFAANGEPQTTIARNVKLSSSANPQDLTQTRSYDLFGNLLSETDWSGSRTTATNTYDIGGRRLTSTDAASVVAHTTYDCMGNTTETYTTAPNTQVKANWSTTTFDAMGRELTVTTKLSDASGNPTTASVVTHTYDGAGNALAANDTTVGGEDGKSTYDAQANTTEQWQEGVRSYATTGASTRSVYDEHGNVLFESAPGNTNTPGASTACSATTYDDAGNALSSREPDGNITATTYSGQGVEIAAEGTTADNFTEWDSATSLNAAGQVIAQTDPQQSHVGLTTTSGFDLLGRTTSATAERDEGSEPATSTTYNDLGWVLQSSDANGVTTSTTYDTHGQVVSTTIGSETSTQTYNATSGRLQSSEDADGTTCTYTYDAFGNATRVLEEASDDTDLKDTNTTYDSLGRPLTASEAVAGTQYSYTYPVNSATGVQETLSYGASAATSLAVTRNARNAETARTATITAGTTVTRAVTDDASGRDGADRWTSASIQQSGRSAKSQSRSFDNADHIVAQSGLGFSSGQSAAYTYDPDNGKKTAAALPLSFGGAIAESYAYYPGGRLAGATTAAGESAYSFDEVGNLVRDALTVAGTVEVATTSFSYDAANRLTRSDYTAAEDDASTISTYYGWDETNAWRTSQGSTATPANHETQMTYNALGRMSSYASPTVTSASYAYDASGQRTKSIVTPAGGTATTTTYAYDGLTLLKLSATQGSDSWKIEYLHDDEDGTPYGGVYRSPTSSTSPTYFSIVTNDHGDVLELCDADGEAFASYRYDAWGSPLSASTQATSLITSTLAGEIASRQILRYASYAFDAESGFYYCSARYYDPATRQWTTGDPAKADGEESAYQYCGGDPVGRDDASGLKYTVRGHQYAKVYRPNYPTQYVLAFLYWETVYDSANYGPSLSGRCYIGVDFVNRTKVSQWMFVIVSDYRRASKPLLTITTGSDLGPGRYRWVSKKLCGCDPESYMMLFAFGTHSSWRLCDE